MSFKTESFREELGNILNPTYRTFAETALENVIPDYFFEIPASSSGKYHAAYAIGTGGLLRHTKAAVRIAIELFKLEVFKYTEDEKDIIIVSLILHDGFKSGCPKEQYTRADHPLICAEKIRQNETLRGMIDEESFNLILGNIETHMGYFDKDFKTGEKILPNPQTKMQHFVHLADFLCSRKCIEFNFDVPVMR